MALLVASEAPPFLHVLLALFIRELLEREGGGGIYIHSIGISCFGVIVSGVLGGPQAFGSWSD